MSVRKRKWTTRKGESKQAWIVDYVDQDGDRHIETFERKKDADAFHATVKVDVSKGEHIAASKSEAIAQAAQHWLNSVEARGRERGTLRQYRQHVDLHIVPRLGSIKLAHLTAPKVKAFRDDLLANLSRPLARKVLVSFKSILKEAKRTQVAAGISIGADQRKRKLEVGVDIPTPDEIKRLLQAATEAEIRPRMLLTLAIFTGLRASELRGLRWKDVDFKHSELHVQQRADRFNAIGMPKSRASVRRSGSARACSTNSSTGNWPARLAKATSYSRPRPVRSRITRTRFAASTASCRRRTCWTGTAVPNTACTRCGTSLPRGASTARPMAGANCRPRTCSNCWGIRRS